MRVDSFFGFRYSGYQKKWRGIGFPEPRQSMMNRMILLGCLHLLLKELRMFTIRDITQIGFMTSLLIVLGLLPAIPLGFIPVPIVFQNLGVMLVGATLGAKKGTFTMLLFFLLGMVIPVFSGKSTTFAALAGPTAGYLFAWSLVPLFMGLLLSRFGQIRFSVLFMLTILIGVIFVDVVGSIWLAHVMNISLRQSLLSNLVFVPGDLLKALVASLVANRLLNRSIFF